MMAEKMFKADLINYLKRIKKRNFFIGYLDQSAELKSFERFADGLLAGTG